MAPAYGFMTLWGESPEKGQWPLLASMPDSSVSPSMPLEPSKLPPWLQSSVMSV